MGVHYYSGNLHILEFMRLYICFVTSCSHVPLLLAIESRAAMFRGYFAPLIFQLFAEFALQFHLPLNYSVDLFLTFTFHGKCSYCLLSIDLAYFRAPFSYIVWSVLYLTICNGSRPGKAVIPCLFMLQYPCI